MYLTHNQEQYRQLERETGQRNFESVNFHITKTMRKGLHLKLFIKTSMVKNKELNKKTKKHMSFQPLFYHPNLPTQEVSFCFIAKTQQAIFILKTEMIYMIKTTVNKHEY
jgi:hypothetical protein